MHLPEEQTISIPTTAEINSATTIAQVSEQHAESAAVAAIAASNTATVAAAEIIEQIEDDEQWLEKHLLELKTELSNLKTEMAIIPQSLTATLATQAELIRTLTNTIQELSVQVTSLQESKATAVVLPSVSVDVPEEVQTPAENRAPEKKRRRI